MQDLLLACERKSKIVRKAVLALSLAFVLAACGAEKAAVTTTSPQPTDRRVGSHGVTVALPDGWHTMPAEDRQISSPVTQVAVSSGPMENRETEGQVADYGPEADACLARHPRMAAE